MVQNTEANKRIEWIDTARGIGILLIILGHLPDLGNIRTWLFSFHLPLFFFLSGYLFKKDIPFLTFLKKKAKTLLLPYAVLSLGIIAYLTVLKVYQKAFSFSYFWHLVLDYIVQRRSGTVWFLTCLFLLEILFWFLSKYLKKYFLLAAIAAISIAGALYARFCGFILPWNLDVCFAAIPFFYLGYLLRQYPKLLQFVLSNKWKTILVLVACAAINLGFCILNCKLGKIEMVDMFGSVYGIYPLMLLSAVGGIGATVLLSTGIKSNVISHIGANSLIYFGWHQQIFMPTAHTIVTKIGKYLSFGQTWFSLFWFIAILLMCAVVENIITRTKLRVLMGKF